MAKTKGLLTWDRCPIGVDELLPDKGGEVDADARYPLRRRQRADGAAVEELALHRRVLDDPALVWIKQIEPRCE